MKGIFQLVKRYVVVEINWIYFSLLFVTLSGLTAWFYLDKSVLQSIGGGANDSLRFFRNFALYGGSLIGSILLFVPFTKDRSWVTNGHFWTAVFFAAIVYSFNVYCYQFIDWVKVWADGPTLKFWMRCSRDIATIVLMSVPVLIWWFFNDRKSQNPYGFKKSNVKPYFYLLLLMMPLIVAATFSADFLKHYPQATKTLNVAHIEQGRFAYGVVYEIFYGVTYVSVEFFFRGFLILVLSRWLGYGAILPIAALYVTIHFGKPLGETISSFFGAIILGVMVIETRSIWGGIIIHVGIAFSMEIAAAIARGGF